MVSVYQNRVVEGSEDISFRCPNCQLLKETDALRVKTVEKLYGFLPILVSRETVLMCPECETTFRTSAKLEDLAALSPDQIGRKLAVRMSFVIKFMVVVSWLLIIVAPVSFVMLMIAYFLTPSSAARWKALAAGGMLVSGLLLVGFALLLSLQ